MSKNNATKQREKAFGYSVIGEIKVISAEEQHNRLVLVMKGCITNHKLLDNLGYSIFHLLIMIMRCIGSPLHHYAYASQKGL